MMKMVDKVTDRVIDRVASKVLVGGVIAANTVYGGPAYAAIAGTQPKGKRMKTFTVLAFGTPLPSDEKK